MEPNAEDINCVGSNTDFELRGFGLLQLPWCSRYKGLQCNYDLWGESGKSWL
ncbi:hypothetical protein DPMN_029433 [Dreissena polymorpha]|uniref:Uncharacterized protein n=1 Tax=Dreissena polymorpha TaxID=45954 RepID=A0A9D4RHD5_DREPO|nr:hypothetical protein DPMN_029433 [Dreissena polymorpha]